MAGSSDATNVLDEVPGSTSLSGFSQPIFSLGGMKETPRMDPASLQDCFDTKYQYGLAPPHEFSYPNPDGDS